MTQPIKPAAGSRDLKFMLASTRQTVALLRAQLRAGQLDAGFFNQRLGSVEAFLDAMTEQGVPESDTRLTKLNEVARMIGSSLDLQTVLNTIMDAIITVTGADRAILFLVNEDSDLAPYAARNFAQNSIPTADLATSSTITRRVQETGNPVLTTNAQEDPRFAQQQSVITGSMRSIMASPLRARGQVIGVIYVDNKIVSGLFSEDDLKLLDALAAQSAIAIENARLFSQTDNALQEKIGELMLLSRVDRQLNETLDSSRVMQILLDCVGQVCSPERASVMMLSNNQVLWRNAGTNKPGNGINNGAESAGQFAVSVDHPLMIEAARTLAPALLLDEQTGLVQMVVPIVRERRIEGVISLETHDTAGFPEPIQSLLKRVADRASLALENARLYDAVQAANLAKSEFVASVAHELKVPMTSIMGYADLIAMIGAVSDQQKSYIGTIKSSVYRMKAMVSDLTDISRLETGYMSVDLAVTPLRAIIETAVENVQPEINTRNHRLVITIPDDLPSVMVDAERLTQVLINMLSNAYKYTPNGGTIAVHAVNEGDDVAINVQDTGVGMTPEQLEKLGTKFWRADNGLGQPGTGLGLAITRNLIELMGGEMRVVSAPGAGSTFTAVVPVA